MSDEQEQPERVWDEYEWERFLQKQDLKTERYLELLEKYADNPDREALIAKEMGWDEAWGELSDEDADEEEAAAWSECAEDDFRDEEEELEEWEWEAEQHPLYQRCASLSVWLQEALRLRGFLPAEDPLVDELSEQVGIMAGKVGAALSGGDSGEIGMTIAYLKRALRASNLALNAAEAVRKKKVLGRVRCSHLSAALFDLRSGVVEMIGRNREEWRRLYGSMG